MNASPVTFPRPLRPFEVQTWALAQRPNQAAKFVLTILALYADERATCFPGIELLADVARMSEKSVRRHLKALQEEGLIYVERRTYRLADGQVRRSSNRYYLLVFGVESLRADLRSYPQSAGQSEPDNLTASAEEVKLTSSGSYPQSAGQSEPDNLTASGPRSGQSVPPKRSPVTANELPDITNPSPPSPPETYLGERVVVRDAASPLGAEPVGSAGEENSSEVGSPSAGFAADVTSGAEGGAQAPPGDGSVITSLGQDSRPLRASDGPLQPTQDDWNAITSALPASMRQGLPPREVVALAELVHERLDAGWKSTSIRAVLASRELPPTVRYLPALVKARLKNDVPVDGVPPRQDYPSDLTSDSAGLGRMSAGYRAAIDACARCDHNGLVEVEGGLARCAHDAGGEAPALAKPRF